MRKFYSLIIASSLLASCADQGNLVQSSGVNPFLWRAALEVVSFIPLASTEAKGGVIITEWQEQKAGERTKLNIYIFTSDLRVDGLKVAVFKQRRSNGRWIDVAVNKNTAHAVENLILTKARTLHLGYAKQ